MNTKVYVANLAAATTENELRDLFSPYGNVAEVNLSKDRFSGRSRGFGCVTMATPEGAHSAIQALHGKAMGTCTLALGATPPPVEHAGQSHMRRSPLRSSSRLY
jgi:RNA recognition motif-containing protein